MKVKFINTIILLVILCFGCKQEQKHSDIEKRQIDSKAFFFINKNLHQPKSLFPADEIFNLLNTDTVIVTRDSIHIYLPKNLFVNTGGIIAETYKLYFVSIFDKRDMVLSNLQTISGNTFLESSGMFYVNAFDEYGIPLTINENKSIGIESGTYAVDNETKLYFSENSNGSVNWINPDEPEKHLVNIPLPIDNWVLTMAFEKGFDTVGKTEQILRSYIATREFIKTRLPRSSFTDSSNYFKIYMNNMDKNLYEADSLCMVYEKNSRNKWADRFKQGIFTYDKNSEAGLYVDTIHYYLHYLEKLTKPKIINTYGVDLEKSNARELLKEKGLTERQIDEAFVLHNRRKRIMQSMDSEKKYTSYFEINKLGWYNFDKELGFDNAQYVSLKTNLSGAPLQYTSLYYALDNYNSVISGYNISGNSFSISPQNDYKTKLPINEPFTVVAISYTEEGILIASKKFNVKQKNEIDLHLKPISEDSLKLYLSEMVKR